MSPLGTPAQLEDLKRVVGRQLRYLNRLQRRLEQTGFPPHDRLFRAARTARNAAQDLNVELHYLSCAPGTVAREPLKPDRPAGTD